MRHVKIQGIARAIYSESLTMLMPQKIFAGRSRSTSLDTLFSEIENRKKCEEHYYSPGRSVCGFTLPSWQRDLVWTHEQSVRFIESAWLGLHLGEWISTEHDWDESNRPLALSGMLIDGQQRFHALESYWNNKFSVFGHKWADLGDIEKKRFLRRPFTSTEVEISNEASMRQLYDRMNFGGTAHLESERAVPLVVHTRLKNF